MSLWRIWVRHKYTLLFFGVVAFVFVVFLRRGSYEPSKFEQEFYKKKPLEPSKLKSPEEELPVRSYFQSGVIGGFEDFHSTDKFAQGPGENGRPVHTDLNSPEVRAAINEFGFNTVASDMIAMNRSIPDTRPNGCKFWQYPRSLPEATVIVVFHNEGWSPLMRTVHSVINRSPKALLKEVLLVDDFSVKEHLKSRLDEYVKTFHGKVRLIRNKKREGLIGSRSIGAANAHGDVVIFLDAHCEANTNWLAPLLAPIAENRSPTHAGGLFAIDRKWFEQLGYYDDGLRIWGGENFELSFKIWQCGGGIVNVPCSRVGHVYRNFMPYNFGGLTGPIVSTNYKRVAEVWMDEYKEYYYAREPFMRSRDAGDFTKAKSIREKNQCKPFKWYVENVAPMVLKVFPTLPPNQAWGEVINPKSSLCLDTMNRPIPGDLGVSSCHHQGGNQLFRINTAGQLATGEWCIVQKSTAITTSRCIEGTVDGPWSFEGGKLRNAAKDMCLAAKPTENAVRLETCHDDSEYQNWEIKEIKV